MAQVCGSLLHTWKTQTEFPSPGFHLAKPQGGRHLVSEVPATKSVSLPFKKSENKKIDEVFKNQAKTESIQLTEVSY